MCFICRFLRPQATEETVQPQQKRLPKQDLQIWWAVVPALSLSVSFCLLAFCLLYVLSLIVLMSCSLHCRVLCVCPLYCRHLQCLVDCAVHFTQVSLEVSLGQCAATLLLDTTLTGDQSPEEVCQITESARAHAVDVSTPISFFTSWNKANKQHSGKWRVCVCVCTSNTPNGGVLPTYLPTYIRQKLEVSMVCMAVWKPDSEL